jgi:2-phosphosulfolactate phosphatase
MKVEVVQLPRFLQARHLVDRAVVVFDVLRATTTMTAALAVGVDEIRVFGSIAEAQVAAGGFTGERLLCGEVQCLPPEGFDLGNSPGVFCSDHRGRTLFMSTTNGTRAIVAAREAPLILAGCLLNAHAVAEALHAAGRDVTLLCAGTDGEVAPEDVIGAGAVIDRLVDRGASVPDSNSVNAHKLFRDASFDLPKTLSETRGGQNVIRVGLQADVDFAARVDILNVVGVVHDHPLRVRLAR